MHCFVGGQGSCVCVKGNHDKQTNKPEQPNLTNLLLNTKNSVNISMPSIESFDSKGH